MRSGDVATVVLAAGASSRLGHPKQLVTVDGIPLVARAASTALAAHLGPVVVVLGSSAEAVAGALAGLDVTLVRNARWTEGIGTSIATGVAAAAADPACSAVILLACDQPRVPAGHLRALAESWRAGAGDTVGSAYGGTVGIPALFARSRFAALCGLPPASGAKPLLADVALPCDACDVDIDTPEDIERL